MNKAIRLTGILLIFCSPVMQAGTIVNIKNQDESTSVMTDGRQARINISATEYVIVNFKDHSVRVVDPQQRQVMLLNGDVAANADTAPRIRTSINRLGSGQVIAGYQTQKFSYSANGRSCGVIYASMDAYQKKGIKELVSAMHLMMEQQRAALGGLASMIDDCTLADMSVSDHVARIGVPMRTEKNGRVDTEIQSIKTGAILPANTFDIPASYKTVTMQGQIDGASRDMAKAQPQMPGRNYQNPPPQMMRQMPQSGQLTPEMIQQMRRAQDMMRQYQQQR